MNFFYIKLNKVNIYYILNIFTNNYHFLIFLILNIYNFYFIANKLQENGGRIINKSRIKIKLIKEK